MEHPEHHLEPDVMMDEIHRIRREIHQEKEGLDEAAYQAWHNEQALQIAQSLGMKLVPRSDRPWAYRTVPLDSADQ